MIASVMALALLAAQADPTQLSGVTVEATPSTAKAARAYVEQMIDPPPRAISLATWRRPICLDVQNLAPGVAAQLAARIAARAEQVGVTTLTGACQPNVSIIATADGRRTATDLVADHAVAFKASSGDTQGDRRDLRRFAERDAPVRWWTIAAQYDTVSREYAEPLWQTDFVRRTSPAYVSFNQSLVRAMVRTIVVIDASRTGAASVEALGDYVAFVVLAETDPDAELRGYPTVLNLWGGENAVRGMSAWDERYLRALYCAWAPQPGGGALAISFYQRSDIAQRMAAPQKRVRMGTPGACDR